MPSATFRFYAELNDFLSPARRGSAFSHTVEPRTTVKDAIEGLGVPHPEVALILVNERPVSFGDALQDGDRVAVYPPLYTLDNPAPELLRPPLTHDRFVLDIHLGKLAVYLRMLGFDTLYRNDYADDELARISAAENRILLTRDRGLLKYSAVVYGYYVRETAPARQLREIVRRYDLRSTATPFHRCLQCNTPLQPVAKADIMDRLLPKTKLYYDDFRICPGCGQIYWQGSHYERMRHHVARILDEPEG
ncbi:MAG: Mut7-C RNAse domain-containing protein [Anaerolineae bacterium]